MKLSSPPFHGKQRQLLVPLLLAGIAFPSSVLAALDPLAGLPLDQLKAGEWRLERQIDKGAGDTELRDKTYCTSPRKDLTQMVRGAALLCKTDVKQTREKEYTLHAQCRLPGISGQNTTVITLHDAQHYSATMETEGMKFGEKQVRKETINAVRLGDCTP